MILGATSRISGSYAYISKPLKTNITAWTNPWIDGSENSLEPGEAFHDVGLERVRYCSPDGKCNQWGELLEIGRAAASEELVE